MNDNTRLILITLGVAVVVAVILGVGLPQNPGAYSAADENLTGPPGPVMITHPLWFIGVAGGSAAILAIMLTYRHAHD